MGSLDMTKRSRDLVKGERRPPPPGAARAPGQRAVPLARSGAVAQGCAGAPGLPHRRPGAGPRSATPGHRVGPVAYADHVGGSCQLSGRVRAAMSTSGSRPGTGLLDRHGERAVLDGVLDQARWGSSAVLVVRGEPGIGKTALLDYAAGRAVGFRVIRAWGVESEMELAFAGLHQLGVPMRGRLGQLPGPQRDALAVAFGMREGPAPDRFLVGLAVLSLLAATAEDQPLACLVDDAQWLDPAFVQCLAFAARPLVAAPVAVILAPRQPDHHDELAGLPALTVTRLGASDAPALLASVGGGGGLQGIPEGAAAAAEDAGLIELGGRVRFVHPLVRSAVYQVASAGERRAAHRALAEATDPDADADRRAWHLAHAAPRPDEPVAPELERSAGRAQARGGLAAAAAFLECAAALTPDRARRGAPAPAPAAPPGPAGGVLGG